MQKIRVLLVDDSNVVCQILTKLLSEDRFIEVVGSAPNGQVALDMLHENLPDLVLLDVEMPVMDGLTALKKIKEEFLKLPVIMFSSLTQKGTETTIQALFLGADSYVGKPQAMADLDEVRRYLGQTLIPKIRQLGKKPAILTGSGADRKLVHAGKEGTSLSAAKSRIDVVAVGVSTGGPPALARFLAGLGKNLPVPVLIVQHMPSSFSDYLVKQLSAHSKLPVKVSTSDELVCPGTVYIAAGGAHMTVEKNGLEVRIVHDHSPPENSCRPSVDVMLRSVAKVYQENALAIILTGMGQDGVSGCREIKGLGGQVLVQDEATSVVWGMPGLVAKNGLADGMMPIEDMGPAVNMKVIRSQKKLEEYRKQ